MSTTADDRDTTHVLTLEDLGNLTRETGNPAETLMNITALIADRFQTDVCSAYLLEPDRATLVLAATVGLRPQCIGTLRMGLHEGLAGLVAEEVRAVAVEQVRNHPRFKYFREAAEDDYQSFLGVPLIDCGVLQGVLVVQTMQPRIFRDDEICMLVEAAAQVAPVISEARTLDRFIAPTLERLWSLARNLWWSWDHDSTGLFRDLDPLRFKQLNHNPVSMLSEIPLDGIERRAQQLMLHSRINYAYRRQRECLEADRTWGAKRARVWRLKVGRCDLLLLDSNVTGNAPEDRDLMSRLYGGDGHVRIRQELLLGVGGFRALKAMGITPGVLHLNEGHSAFAVLEAIRSRMNEEGVDFEEAARRVSRQVVFTTHTPVPAGHDRFHPDLIEEHLGPLREALGISQERLMAFGRENPANPHEEFCMTILGLKLSWRANAVSALHGEVSRAMWTGLYPDKPEESVPIGHITNGVHVPTWLAPQMFRLYDRHFGPGWHEHSSDARIWEGIEKVDDGELWETHLSLKAELLDFVRTRAIEQARYRGEPPESVRRVLSPDALTIGFARRFATYKRANLILPALDKLASMANDPKRPIQFIFAGKAHPRDDPGKRVLQQMAELMRHRQFADKFVFVEDYDINVGRHMVRGVDVWLNNPRRPLEASGTSGQKVVLNGGLNLSVLDGWWAEAFDGLNGFAIGTGRTHSRMDVHDQRDGDDLFRVLQNEVIPLYYQRDQDGLPRGWIKRMKRTIRTLGWRFNADRMVMNYALHCYVPAAGGTSCSHSETLGG